VKNSLPIPDRIENAPSIMPGLELYYIGFLDLTSSRSVGMGLGPISWQVIQDYSISKELEEDQIEAMHVHIVAMDVTFLEHQKKKSK